MTARVAALSVLFLTCLRSVAAQERPTLHGRIVDSAGAGVRAAIAVRDATMPDSTLGETSSGEDGRFRVSLIRLSARLLLQASVDGVVRAQLSLDSSVVRPSASRPAIMRIGAPQQIAQVEVRARYQRRPSVFNYFSLDPTTRAEPLGSTSSYYDPLTLGSLGALLGASPDMLAGQDGAFSALGAPADANQLQIDGVQMPSGLGTGLVNGTLSLSPWDASVGGAAGATLNLFIRQAGRFRHSYAIVRTGATVPPHHDGAADNASGLSVPVKGWLETTGPIGRYAYRLGGFVGLERSPLRQWSGLLADATRSVLDSLASVLAVPSIRESRRRAEGGFIGRVDFVPEDPKRVLSLSAALSRTSTDGVIGGGFVTGSADIDIAEDAGFLKLESSRVLHERVLWTAILSGAFAERSTDRSAVAPGILVSDAALGHVILAGGAAPRPTSGTRSAEARSSWTWYSTDNRVRYVGQLQARFERAHQGSSPAHSAFTVPTIDALRAGSAIAMTRDGGIEAGHAQSLVMAPSMTARLETGRRGSLLLGLRADGWSVSGLANSDAIRAIDWSPRVAIAQQVGRRRQGGPIATLRLGAGRFTSWPQVRSWSDAWTAQDRSLERCSGVNVPPIDLGIPDAACASGGSVQTIAGVQASPMLRPTAANRADASIAFTEILPGVRAELGAAVAHTNRISTRMSPLTGALVVETLAGESQRALLVPADSIGADGTVPVAEVPSGVPSAELLAADGSSRAVQWRLRLATRDPFARLKIDASYVLTTGRERSIAVAPPAESPGLVSGPLSAGGRHTVALSLGAWLGPVDVRFSTMLRSGVRFTPLADRDLNADGQANDAVFIPASEAQSLASAVAPRYRDCVRDAAGRIAGVNSCAGPWSVWSLLHASLPGAEIGLPRGSVLDLQVSNPLGVFARSSGHPGVVFGPQAPVDPTLVHVTGFDPVAERFEGVPLSRFGTIAGVALGASAPVQIAVSVRLPFGPSITSQRAAAALAVLATDTSSRARERAATTFLADLPPVPILVLRSGEAAGLTTEQREKLQGLATQWSATANRLFVQAISADNGMDDAAERKRERLIQSRSDFMVEVQAIAAEIRGNLTPDQIDLLPEGIRRMLSPRFLRYLAALDSGEF